MAAAGGPVTGSAHGNPVEIIAYLYTSYLAARHLARRAGDPDWMHFMPIALAWPFFPVAWAFGRLTGVGR